MSGYQHLQKYKGSLYGNLNYSGIEYDFEVPDNVVIASPGGVSAIHHHYTKGLYSPAVSNQDIYAGEGVAHPYGEYGNLYQTGPSATRYMGDFKMHPQFEWEGPYPSNPLAQNLPNKVSGATAPSQEKKKDNYTPIELISPPDSNETTPVNLDYTGIPQGKQSENTKKQMHIKNIFGMAAVLIVGYTAMNFWVKGGEEYISQRFFGEQPLGWKQFFIIAITLSAVTVAMMYFFGEPLVTLEKM